MSIIVCIDTLTDVASYQCLYQTGDKGAPCIHLLWRPPTITHQPGDTNLTVSQYFLILFHWRQHFSSIVILSSMWCFDNFLVNSFKITDKYNWLLLSSSSEKQVKCYSNFAHNLVLFDCFTLNVMMLKGNPWIQKYHLLLVCKWSSFLWKTASIRN